MYNPNYASRTRSRVPTGCDVTLMFPPTTMFDVVDPRTVQHERRRSFHETASAKFMYMLATLLGSIGFVVSIRDLIDRLNVGVRPRLSTVISAWSLAIAFALKVPYIWPKKVARWVLIIWSIGWTLTGVLGIIGYMQGREELRS